MRFLFKKFIIVLFLTLFFVTDEVLIYVFGIELFNWNASPVILTVGLFIVLGLNLLLALTVYKIFQRKPTTGVQGMIDSMGVVVRSDDTKILVKTRGEIWNAQSSDKLRKGEKVIIEKIVGLELFVRKAIGP